MPSVDNGSQVASAFVAGFTRLETALKQAASKAQSLPTTSASVFKSAAFALCADTKGGRRSGAIADGPRRREQRLRR